MSAEEMEDRLRDQYAQIQALIAVSAVMYAHLPEESKDKLRHLAANVLDAPISLTDRQLETTSQTLRAICSADDVRGH